MELKYKAITKITGKSPNTWKLDMTLLNNTWIKEKVSRKIRKYFQPNGNIKICVLLLKQSLVENG